MAVSRLYGVCSVALGVGLVAAFRNLEKLAIVPVMNIVANFGIAIGYLYLVLMLPLPLFLLALPFAIIPMAFGLLLLAYMLTTKGSFSAAFSAAPTKK